MEGVTAPILFQDNPDITKHITLSWGCVVWMIWKGACASNAPFFMVLIV